MSTGTGLAAVTRRTFLEWVGKAGGGAAVYESMRALDLTGTAAPVAFAPLGRAPRNSKVIVLGAGLAGLSTAYELEKLGYACHVLEARTRVGGRCHSIRRGTVSEEPAAAGGQVQVAGFDEGLYYNAGPARIPHHHATTLSYCRELGVPIEMFCSVNEAAYVHQSAEADPACRRVRLRELRADWRGYTSELLAKALSQESLDRPMTLDDRDRIVDWLKREGALGADLTYAGTPRRGYRVPPSAGDVPGLPSDPLNLGSLVHTTFGGALSSEIALQMPMFQVVGGMDRLAKTLATRVHRVTLGADVQAVEQPEGRVRVRYREGGAVREIEGHYLVSTIPLTVLRDVAFDVSPAMQQAIGGVAYSHAGKIGLQFKRRFWEQDDGIYGGISKTDLPITQILYPSQDFLSRKGVLVGYYHNGDPAKAMGALTPAQRLSAALEQGRQIHPQYDQEFESGFSIAWQQVTYNRGGWAQYTEAQRRAEYATLLQPDRAVYLAGDYLTYLSGWMAGAFESARSVVQALHERASRDATSATATQAQE